MCFVREEDSLWGSLKEAYNKITKRCNQASLVKIK